jgi:hypothetical protein
MEDKTIDQKDIEKEIEVAFQEGYDQGYEAGHKEGYDEGFEEGRKEGYDEGYEEGERDGYERGYDRGYEDGREAGYDAGYEDGSSNSDAISEAFVEGELNGKKAGYIKGLKEGASKVKEYIDKSIEQGEIIDDLKDLIGIDALITLGKILSNENFSERADLDLVNNLKSIAKLKPDRIYNIVNQILNSPSATLGTLKITECFLKNTKNYTVTYDFLSILNSRYKYEHRFYDRYFPGENIFEYIKDPSAYFGALESKFNDNKRSFFLNRNIYSKILGEILSDNVTSQYIDKIIDSIKLVDFIDLYKEYLIDNPKDVEKVKEIFKLMPKIRFVSAGGVNSNLSFSWLSLVAASYQLMDSEEKDQFLDDFSNSNIVFYDNDSFDLLNSFRIIPNIRMNSRKSDSIANYLRIYLEKNVSQLRPVIESKGFLDSYRLSGIDPSDRNVFIGLVDAQDRKNLYKEIKDRGIFLEVTNREDTLFFSTEKGGADDTGLLFESYGLLDPIQFEISFFKAGVELNNFLYNALCKGQTKLEIELGPVDYEHFFLHYFLDVYGDDI